MLKKTLLITILLSISHLIIGQTIEVLNYTTGAPIENVKVYNRTETVILFTNHEGQISLNEFKINELVYFSHPSFEREKRSISQIVESEYKVEMLDQILLPTIEIKPPRETAHEDFSAVRIDKISKQEINFSVPQTSADMLQKNSNILVQKSQAGGGSPIIRGFEANKILLVVDGVRMNNAIYRSGHLQNAITVDANILESTDVFYGPGSVIYGSDALGGVIHFHTKNPELSEDSTANIHTNFMTRVGSANGENTNHIDFNYGRKKWGSLTSVTFSSFEDFKMGKNRTVTYPNFGKIEEYVTSFNGTDYVKNNPDQNSQPRTAYNQLDLLQKFTFQYNDQTKLLLNMQYSTSSQINRFDKLNERRNGNLRFAEWYYGPQNRLLTSLKLESKKNTKLYDYYTVIAAFQKIDEDRIERAFQSTNRITQNEDVFVYSMNADFFKKLSKKEVVYYGLELTHNDVNSSAWEENINTGVKTPAQTRYPNGKNRITSAAFYATVDKMITEDLIVNIGARYNHFLNFSTLTDSSLLDFPFNKIDFNTGALSGSFSVKYEKNGFRGELIGSSGFRSPNVDDYGKVFEKNGNLMVPNNQLRPEFVYNGEVNGAKRWEKDDKEYLMIKIAGFYTAISNAILRANFQLNGKDSVFYQGAMVNLQSNQNISSAHIYGSSVDARVSFTTFLQLTGSFNYTQGRNLEDNEPLAHIPPIFGRVGLTFSNKRIRVQANSQYNGWKKAADFSPNGEDNLEEATVDGSPSWITFNLYGSFKINKNLSIMGSIENIMDTHYKQFASGVSALGRNFNLSLRANF